MQKVSDFGVHFFCEYAILYEAYKICLNTSDVNLEKIMNDVLDNTEIILPLELDFGDSNVGIRCVQFPEMESWALHSELIEYDSSGRYCTPKISANLAQKILNQEGRNEFTRRFVSEVYRRYRVYKKSLNS